MPGTVPSSFCALSHKATTLRERCHGSAHLSEEVLSNLSSMTTEAVLNPVSPGMGQGPAAMVFAMAFKICPQSLESLPDKGWSLISLTFSVGWS